MALSILTSLVCYRAVGLLPLFVLCIQTNYAVLAGIFAIFPTSVVTSFGSKHGAQVYTAILVAGSISGLTSALLVNLFYKAMGVNFLLQIGTACSVACLVICALFDEEPLEQQDSVTQQTVVLSSDRSASPAKNILNHNRSEV